MAKYDVYVSGSIKLTIEAESEEKAEELVEDVCAGEKSLEEAGLSGKAAEAILQVSDWCIDVYPLEE